MCKRKRYRTYNPPPSTDERDIITIELTREMLMLLFDGIRKHRNKETHRHLARLLQRATKKRLLERQKEQ